jgi:CubicO group peptidase (beta-lactamase class C family)
VLQAGLAGIRSRDLAVHSLLVVRHGRLVFEQYGVDGDRQWTPADVHEMRSTTKTLTSMLIGIAIADDLISSVRARAAEYFDEGEIDTPV